MKKVRAKFECESVTDNDGGKDIFLRAATCGSEENDSFFKCTPAGELSIGIVNPPASDMFVPGKEYFIDITPANQD